MTEHTNVTGNMGLASEDAIFIHSLKKEVAIEKTYSECMIDV